MQPGVDLLMPVHGVVWFEHPVILVREVQEAALDPAALQRGEGHDALGDWYSIIQFAMDDQHGRLPLVDIIRGVVALVAFGIDEIRAALLSLDEP